MFKRLGRVLTDEGGFRGMVIAAYSHTVLYKRRIHTWHMDDQEVSIDIVVKGKKTLVPAAKRCKSGWSE